jgi:hypothetical protein
LSEVERFELRIGTLSRRHDFVPSHRYDPVPLISVLLLGIISWRIVETGTHSTGISFDSQPKSLMIFLAVPSDECLKIIHDHNL